MRISVVIPTFNRCAVIGRALDSVLAQEVPADEMEVIVVDDGSNDATEEIIRHRYPDVHYIAQDQQGVSAARNTGAGTARGNWLAFLDSDDEWKPGKLRQQLLAAEDNPSYKVLHCEEIWFRHGVRVNPMRKHAKPEGWIFEHCLPRCCVSPSTVMIDRQLFLDNGGFDESLPACEDYDLWLRLFLHHPVYKVAEPLVTRYGGHGDQLSARYWGMDRFRVRALVKLLENESLDADQHAKVLATLAEKLDVLINGADKRGQEDTATMYREIRDSWINSGVA